MNDNLVIELKNTIKNIKIEILEKRQQLESLILKYQALTGIDLDELEDDLKN